GFGRDDGWLVRPKNRSAVAGSDRRLRSIVSGLLFTMTGATCAWEAVSAAKDSSRRRALGPLLNLRRGGREQGDERALDGRLPRRRGDLRPEQIGDVEHVDHALAEGRHVGGGDVEGKLRQGRRQLEQQAGAIEPGDLDHGVAARTTR